MTDQDIRFDTDFARGLFPEPCWNWSFFDNAGGAYVPESVIDRLTGYMRECQVQPGGPFGPGKDAKERMDLGHASMAALIDAAPDEVVIGPSTSINVYVLSKALRPLWADGDRVIVSDQNHEANAGPWHRLAETGIEVVVWPVDPVSGRLSAADLEPLLNERTRLVAFPHVSNLAGEVNDVAAITRLVHDAGAQVCVDGVAFAPHRAIEVKAWDVDYYLFSFYKLFGPHIGCLYGKRDLLLASRNQYHFFIGEARTTYKLNPAGPQHEIIASLTGIADYITALCEHHFPAPFNSLHQQAKAVSGLVEAREDELCERFLAFLASKSRVRLVGPGADDVSGGGAIRVPTFAFTVEGMASASIPPLLEAERAVIGHGDFYARRLVDALGLDPADGVVRASMVHYTSDADVDRLIAGLDRVIPDS
ncbi:MAG: aminotransferase class V-fold PLP-dependent enzyme [Rhodospirillales bacterium]